MKLHELSNTFRRPARKRVGRGDGSGSGRTAGRGEKGAGARSGTSYRPHFEGGQIPLFRRLPKRGFMNPARRLWETINVAALNRFDEGAVVDAAALAGAGLVSGAAAHVKLLGQGEMARKLTVKVGACSASARAKIEAAGGTCEMPQE